MKKTFCLLILPLLILDLAFKNQPKSVSWEGKYEYNEEPVKALAGYSMVMEWQLIIKKARPTAYTGILEVNGQQTFLKLLTDIKVNGNSITIIYNKTLDGADYGAYKRGETLFTLEKVDRKLVTKWAKLTPMLFEKFPPTCSCFAKK